MRKKAANQTEFPSKAIIDTNVPKISNRTADPDGIPNDLVNVVEEAVRAIKWFVETDAVVVLDEGEEIMTEYRGQLSSSGQPGLGDAFMKWIYNNCDKCEKVRIHKTNDSYREFPKHEGLKKFDRSDRKFVAVANAHPEKPPILEATDDKWWGWKSALNEMGITVVFLDENYVKKIWERKFEKP